MTSPSQRASSSSIAGSLLANAGQACVAGSRLLVEQSIQAEFTARLVEITEKMRLGDPLDLGTEAGAVSSETQLVKDLDFIAGASREGARLLTGGTRILAETGGYFREEVFGPVLSVLPFRDEAEAVAIANSTPYGLASAVWTADLSRAHRMIRAIKAGVVHVNTYGGADNTVPLGGMRQSGNGHDKSLHALDKYTELKTAWIQL